MVKVEKNKKIQFNYLRDVVIVPNREEYIKYGVWWNQEDYLHFKESAFNEIIMLTTKYKTLNLTQALAILYRENYNLSNSINTNNNTFRTNF